MVRYRHVGWIVWLLARRNGLETFRADIGIGIRAMLSPFNTGYGVAGNGAHRRLMERRVAQRSDMGIKPSPSARDILLGQAPRYWCVAAWLLRWAMMPARAGGVSVERSRLDADAGGGVAHRCGNGTGWPHLVWLPRMTLRRFSKAQRAVLTQSALCGALLPPPMRARAATVYALSASSMYRQPAVFTLSSC